MSGTDNRIVNMQFNNQQFENGIKTSLKSLDELKKKLNMDDSAKSLSNLQTAANQVNMQGLGENVNTVASRFSSLGIMGVTALANITNSAVTAGVQLLKSLTIDPIKTGLDEYETKINAITTIMTNTKSKGTTLDDVNAALNELNKYADLTIYNFAEMTRNIGTFTAAGVGLKDSVTAIKGIANLAAGSGSNAQQASTAMYQLSQALASGTVKLMDWNSVVNAGMGGELFQNALKKTAKEMGIVVQKGVPFRETLKSGWLTSDVLIKTLEKFAKDKTLVDAATQVKTFTQLISTMKESVQSGWSMSWEYILGDKDQAAKLFTAMNNGFSDLMASSTNARNSMLKFWNTNGGRDAMIKGLTNAFHTLYNILSPISKAFHDIFPRTTGQQLIAITKKFEELTKVFSVGEKGSERLRATFRGLFSVLKIFTTLFKIAAKVVLIFAEALVPVLKGVTTITSVIGKLVTGFSNAITKGRGVTDIFERLGKVVNAVGESLGTFAGSIGKVLGKAFADIGKMVSKLSDSFAKSNADPTTLFAGLNVVSFTAFVLILKHVIQNFSDMLSRPTELVNAFKKVMEGVEGCLTALQTTIRANAILKIAVAISLLAGSILLLSSIDPKSMATAVIGLASLTGILFGFMTSFEKASKGFAFLTVNKVIIALIGMAAALDIMASAIRKIATLKFEDLVKGLIGIFSMTKIMLKFANTLAITSGSLVKGAVVMIAFATALGMMANAVTTLGKLSFVDVATGLASIFVLMKTMSIFLNKTDLSATSLTVSITMLAMAGAMVIFASAMTKIAAVNLKGIGKALGSIVVIFTSIALFSKAMNGVNAAQMLVLSATMVIMAKALTIFANVMTTLGGLTWNETGKGLYTIAVGLTVLALAMRAMASSVAGAAAMILAATALAILAPPLMLLSGISWKGLGKSMTALAGSLLIMGVAGSTLLPMVPAILAVSVALAALGAAAIVVGAALTALGTGLAALAAGLSAFISIGSGAVVSLSSAIKIILQQIIEFIPQIIEQIGVGIMKVLALVIDNAPLIQQAITSMLVSFVKAFTDTIPQLVNAVVVFIKDLLTTLATNMPAIIQAGANIVIALLQGIANNIAKIVGAAIDIVVNFIEGIASKIGDIIQAGYDLMIAFLNGLADAINKNSEKVGRALARVVKAAIKGAIMVIFGFVGSFVSAGKKLISGLVKGIKGATGSIWPVIKGIVSKIVSEITKTVKRVYNAGRNIVMGLINGIKSGIGMVVDAAKNLGSKVLSALKSKLKEQSPSKATYVMGMYIDEGLSNGVLDGIPMVVKACNQMGAVMTGKVYEAAKKTVKNGKDVFDAFLQNFGYIGGASQKAKTGLNATAKAVNNYVMQLYKETDTYKDMAKSLASYKKKRTKYYDLMKKYQNDHSKNGQKNYEKYKKLWKDAKKNIKDLFATMKGASKDGVANMKAVYKQLHDTIKGTFTDMMDIFSVSLDTNIDLFKKFNEDLETISPADLLSNMQSQVEGIATWNDNLNKLAEKGFASGLIEQLKNLGPSAANYVEAFMNMTTEQMNEANTRFAQSSQLTAQTLLSGFKDSVKTAEEYTQNIKNLALMGLDQDVLEALVNKGTAGAEYVTAFLSMTAEQIEEFNKTYAESQELPDDLADSVIASLIKAGDSSTDTAKSLATLLGISETETIKLGTSVGNNISKGISSSTSKVVTASTNLSTKGLHALKSGFNTTKGKNISKNICFGMVQGLQDGAGDVAAAAAKVAEDAYKAAMHALKAHSPSRKFMDVGMYSDQGFAIGLIDNSGNVEKAAMQVGESTLSAMRDTITAISNCLSDEMDVNPTITPVLDMDQMLRDAKYANAQMNDQMGIDYTSMDNNIDGIVDTNGLEEIQNGSKKSNYSFVQNNYSPKSLSRSEIYRQTKNQFSAAKGAINE